MIRIALVVKSQQLFNKVRKIFPEPRYEVSRNISHIQELKEFLISDEADIAIIDNMINWKEKGINLFKEYDIDVFIFEGDLEELEKRIAEKSGVEDSQQFTSIPADSSDIVITPSIEIPLPLSVEDPNPEKVVSRSEVTPLEPKRTSYSTPTISSEDSAEKKILEAELNRLRRELLEAGKEREQIAQEILRKNHEIERLLETQKQEPDQIQVEVEVEGPERYIAIPQKFIIVGGLYQGVGVTFLGMILARLLDSMNIETLFMEFPRNDPYLFYRLGGQKKVSSDYSFYYSQMLDLPKGTSAAREEWVERNITWMPADPEKGPLLTWGNDDMRKAVYRSKQTITILDIGTAWMDPALEDVLAQAHHILLLCGPDPAKMASAKGREIVQMLRSQKYEAKLIANYVPDPPIAKTREWLAHAEEFSFPLLCSYPCLDHQLNIQSIWSGQTPLDLDEDLLYESYNHLMPILKTIIPQQFIIEHKPRGGGFFQRFKKKNKKVTE
ncbi:hypothetical protein A8L34_27965 [Bacillus sp. FJAT-27264]|uniref:hypothetical protein n=1 Tax=Paenibacillus sp. (strain DSM 101736 / FJAT-27264) TaxID=1850362 RepID=UPI000807C592|nr:hypothetical protein [Bacillus sp. FJAT-27264]OBZ15885.1 hypothetical protein A8L34_27965 [Bacillus sp. FJAT-27264]